MLADPYLLSQVTDVCQFYGSTEVGPVQVLVPSRKDWASLEWHPGRVADVQLFENNTYEMTLYKDPNLEGIRGFSCNFPDLEVYRTKDLFQPHAIKPNLWRFYGRIDDIIVLSIRGKFNPIPSEVIIAAYPQLSGPIIAGQGRFQTALLVEPKDKGEVQKGSLIEAIWPTVEQASAQAPEHARVTRSMIAIAHAKKPFEQAGKGTVIRKLIAEKFAPEVERLRKATATATANSELKTENGIAACETFAALRSVNTEWMGTWMDRLRYRKEFWQRLTFLSSLCS